jgi:enediyne biosynthesis protein E4
MTAGNFHGAKPEFGYTDADYGLLLLGDGKGDFKALRSKASGLRLEGEIRDIASVKSGKKTRWIALRNNGAVQAWE